LEKDIEKIESYFYKNVFIFDNSKSVFCHTDIHMGNILHDKYKLTSLLDFDSSVKAPLIQMLPTIFGFIENPEQFFE
jgi:aminoglycoside phosphotransferase (APT) family kinase protein